MESRKNQLQKQIIKAQKADDNDLYLLLKSQWAHRFGVDSLEELNNLDIKQENQPLSNEDNQKADQLREYVFEDAKEISIKDDDSQEKEIANENKKASELIEVENKDYSESKSYQIVNKDNDEKKAINPVIDYKNVPKVKALIPLPPKPKYSYLRKWLLISKS